MLYERLLTNQGICSFALLIDPDRFDRNVTVELCRNAEGAGVDAILIGGSLISSNITQMVSTLKAVSSLPLILFPGSALQFSPVFDAVFLLSLISGRNPEFLIGNHVQVAMQLRDSRVEVIPTGYILIDGGLPTSVQYMSNTMPIPAGKPEIAVATAVAGEQLGLKAIYLEAGSGALSPVPAQVIQPVKANVNVPIIAGGGLKTPEQVRNAVAAGASMVVVGTAAELNPGIIERMVRAIK